MVENNKSVEPAQYKIHIVKEGNFTVNVLASGTLYPKNKVKVGVEISGTIAKIYKDYNDPVSKGEVLAKLRTDQLEARVNQLRAALDSAQARTFNFVIEDMKEIIKTVKKQTSILTTFVSAIAGIRLLVGGIGIMNIMLVSVVGTNARDWD